MTWSPPIHDVAVIYGDSSIAWGVIRVAQGLVRRLQTMWARCKANATKGSDR